MSVDTIVLILIVVGFNALTKEVKLGIITSIDIALVSFASTQVFADSDLIYLKSSCGAEEYDASHRG